jgi:hypothetical protein
VLLSMRNGAVDTHDICAHIGKEHRTKRGRAKP